MRVDNTLPLFVGLFVASQASVIPSQTRQNDSCAQIHQRAIQACNKSEIAISGDLAIRCLKELPFESKRATSFVKEYRKYLQFESDIEILKSPPSGYHMPPVDLLGGLDEIERKAATGEYKSQYDFDAEIKALTSSAYQGHLSVSLCSFSLFNFRNSVPLVSISSNGTSLPEVYTKADALQLRTRENSVSPIKAINGQSVVDFMKKLPTRIPAQDWDALYNYNFLSNPFSLNNFGGVAGQWSGIFSQGDQWPGASHVLRFANGSTATVETVAVTKKFPYRNSKDVYKGICLPGNSNSSSSPISALGSSLKPQPIPSGYPEPFIRDKYNQILGFYPNNSHLEDVGILAVTTFDTTVAPSQAAEFSKIASEFVIEASKRDKKKILIDVSGNGGGNVVSGHNLFRIFFPETDDYAATRFRSHDAVDLLGQAGRDYPNNATNDLLPFFYRGKVKPDQTHGFSSWEDLYGPHKILGVNSSSLYADNLTAVSQPNDPINGYGIVPANPAKKLFAAKDIVLITDGTCASTCSIFAALMKQQGVRTIAFGGRPSNRPMQGVGGTRGARAMEFEVYGEYFALQRQEIEKSLNTSTPLLTKEELSQWDEVVPLSLDKFPLVFPSGSINILNNYGPHDSETPLQFLYEAAECRRFFTLGNIFNQETVWASAADAMFDGGACVPGSTNATGSLFA